MDNQVAMSLTSSSSSSSSSSADDAAPRGGVAAAPARLRGARLLRAISRRIGRRRAREAEQAEQAFRSSSTDSDSLSCSSGDDAPSRVGKDSGRHNSGYRSSSCSSLHQTKHSCSGGSSSSHSGSNSGSSSSHSGSNSGSDSVGSGGRAGAMTRAFQSLGLAARSRSASSSPSSSSGGKKRGKPQQPQRSILRPPVSYAYVRGISGLPTQRVPRSYHAHCAAYAPTSVCCRNT